MLVFIQKTFCELFLLFFLFFLCVCVCVLYCCLGMVKEKRGRRGGQGEDAWSIKFDVHIRTNKSHYKASSKSKHHTIFYLYRV